jgi:hypothetical protein
MSLLDGDKVSAGLRDMDTSYDSFLSRGSWINGLYAAVPAAVFLAGMSFFAVPEEYWTPVLLIWIAGFIGHSANWGFMSANVQTKVSCDLTNEVIRMVGAATLIKLEEIEKNQRADSDL